MNSPKHSLTERLTVTLGLALEEIHNPGTARVCGYDICEMIESLIRESTKTHGVPQMITDEAHRRARIAEAASPLHLDAMIAAGFRGHLTPRGYIRESGWPTVHPKTREHERREAYNYGFENIDPEIAANWQDGGWASIIRKRIDAIVCVGDEYPHAVY